MDKPIKRHQALIQLSRDHHSGLLLAAVLKSDVPQYRDLPSKPEERMVYARQKFETELKEHFRQEEQILFPFSKGRNPELDRLADELISEHRTLENMFANFVKEKDLESSLDKCGKLLEQHIRKEERNYFQLVQETFSEEELEQLSGKLNS